MISKAKVEKLIMTRDFERLVNLAEEDKRVVRFVMRCLYHADELRRKKAVEALGIICNSIAEKDARVVLNILRQLWWSVNDESGGIGWSAPEAMAEIVKHRPDDFSAYGSIALSYLDEELLCRGSLWAAGTLAKVRPGFVSRVLPQIKMFLKSDDPVLRGYAARALSAAGVGELEPLQYDRAPVTVYEKGALSSRTVAELAGF